jgi:ribosome-interacting GTPase 1
MIGFPSVGKSTLLSELTETKVNLIKKFKKSQQ